MKLAAILLLLFAQDTPDHPDQLQYKPLSFEAPDPGDHRVELEGGAVAFLVEDRSLPIIELEIRFRGGGFWDAPGKEGVASATGSLMRTGGAGRFSPSELDEEIDLIAADIGVSIGGTSGTVTMSVLSKNLDRGMELLGLILRKPMFDQGKLDLVKAQSLQAMKARNDSTGGIEGRERDLLLYGEYPLNRHPVKASIESLTREDLQAVHQRTFHPKNFVIAAAGDFEPAAFAKKLEALFGQWPHEAQAVPAIPKVTHTPKPGVYTVHKDGDQITQGRVTIAHLGIDVHHPDVNRIRIVDRILGRGGFSSRLMQKVRTEHGLAYSVYSTYSAGALYPGIFRMAFQSKSESCTFAAELCLKELDRIQNEAPSEEEVKNAIQFYLDGFPRFFFSTPFHTAQTFAGQELNGIPKDYYTKFRNEISKVTPQVVQEMARKYCRRDQLVFLFVGNTQAIDQGDGKRKLADFGPVTAIPLPDPLTLERPK